MNDERDKLRSFGKPPRFDQRDPGKTFAKVLPGISQEEAQAMVKRFFTLWPEAAKHLGLANRTATAFPDSADRGPSS